MNGRTDRQTDGCLGLSSVASHHVTCMQDRCVIFEPPGHGVGVLGACMLQYLYRVRAQCPANLGVGEYDRHDIRSDGLDAS